MTTTTQINPPFDPAVLQATAKDVHATAIEKGWWGEGVTPTSHGSELYATRDHVEVMLLCMSELFEAFEEYRKKDSDVRVVYFDTKNPEANNKPEGFPVELADCVIRVLDNLRAQRVNIVNASKMELASEARWYEQVYSNNQDASTVVSALMQICACFGTWACVGAGETRYGIRALYLMFALAKALDIDLQDAMTLKTAYNKTRPYRHGGKRC